MHEDRQQTEPTEIVFHPDESGSRHLCVECEQQATDIYDARSDVIRYAGKVAVSMLPLIIILSFADSVIHPQPLGWQPDGKIIAGVLSALAGIMLFAFKTRGNDDHRQ